MKKIIQYKVESQWGNRREFVVNKGDAQILAQLTGKKTIDSVTRELIRDLTCGMVSFEQVLN
jgi:nuclear transport factor 2 (NTF2) superfamily protein